MMSSSGSIRRAAALFAFLLAFAAFASFAGPAVTAWGAGFDGLFEAGDGTEKNPYVITTEKELRAFAARVDAERMNAGLFFKLGGDIDVSSANWTPIGNSRQFTGIFDGDGHKITGLNIPAEANVRYAGLFGRINGATIKNLRLETAAGGAVAASADSSSVYAGGIAAQAYSGQNQITNCTVNAVISANGNSSGAYAAGIVADAYGAQITNCTVNADVSANGESSTVYVGGITAYNAGLIADCHIGAGSSITGGARYAYAGGISAYIGSSAAQIVNCEVEADISAAGGSSGAYAGGVVGYAYYDNERNQILNCHVNAGIRATGNSNVYAGGIAGGGGSIAYSSSTGEVSAEGPNSSTSSSARAGGISGYSGLISNSYSRSNVSAGGASYVQAAGISPSGQVEFCYALGTVSGKTEAFDASTNAVYAVAPVNYTLYSYYLAGSGIAGESEGGFGRTAEELRRQSTFSAWDFDNGWSIAADANEGYPYLNFIPYEFPSGDGTEENPYIVTAEEDLIGVRQYQYLDKHFKLDGDIDLTKNWLPVGITTRSRFKGSIDGGGFAIRGLNVPAEAGLNHAGLFGIIEGAKVRNLVLETAEGGGIVASPATGTAYAGGIAAEAYYTSSANYSQILNCRVDAGVRAVTTEEDVSYSYAYAGGLVGYFHSYSYSAAREDEVQYSSSTGTVSAEAPYSVDSNAYAGGLTAVGGIISNSFSKADVKAQARRVYAAGLSSQSSRIENCYALGAVTGIGKKYSNYNLIYALSPRRQNGTFYSYHAAGATDTPEQYSGGAGRTREQLKQQSTFSNWDFDGVWKISSGVNDGYPHIDLRDVPPHAYVSGTGTEEDPYVVMTEKDLFEVRKHLDKHFKLGYPIALTKEWMPIAHDSSAYFRGSFDGDGFEISGLNIPVGSGVYYAGLFGFVQGSIKNLGIVIDGDVNGDPWLSGSTGGLAAHVSGGSVTNCYVKGAGTVNGGENNSYGRYTGGLIGENHGTVSDSHSAVDVKGGPYTGGLIGHNYGDISNSYARSTVTGSSYVGGLVGYSSGGDISASYARSTVTGSSSVGGLVGYSSGGDISTSYSNSTVSGDYDVGGLAGYLYRSSPVTNSYARGSVQGRNRTGGLIGGIHEYYSEYSVIEGSYAACAVAAETDVGGLVGYGNAASADVTITNSYYDSDLCGFTDSPYGTPKTNFEMQTQSSLTGFDFEAVWNISPSLNGGYPHLRDVAAEDDEGDDRNILVTISNASVYLGYRMYCTAPNVERILYVSTPNVYYFSGLDSEKTYKVELLSPVGVMFGAADNIAVTSEDARITFDSLPLPKTASVVLRSGGTAVPAADFTVKWYDGETLLAEGQSVQGLKSGMRVRYEISLSDALSALYKTPAGGTLTVSETESENNVSVDLAARPKTKIGGTVISGGAAIGGATITIEYYVGSELFTITLTTDADGRYETELPAGGRIAGINVNKFGYLDYAWTPDTEYPEDVELPVDLTKTEGLIVSLSMNYTRAVEQGETPVVSPLTGTANLRFTARNTTQNKDVPFGMSGLSLVLSSDAIAPGDAVEISAADVTGNMTDAKASFTVQDNSAALTLDFIQHGHWEARNITSANAGDMALLYDSAGKYVATVYAGGMNIISGVLSAGQYSVILVGRSELLRHIANLSDFASLGLVENTDYVRRSVTIEPGVVAVIGGLTIPTLDETKLYYTDPARTFLTANKTEAPLGALITMRAEYVFAEKYAKDAAAKAVTVTVPEGCSLLADSVSVDGHAASYTNTARGFEVPVTSPAGVVRFYIAQKTPGEHAVNTFLRFSYDGNTLLQSVGTIVLKAPELTLDAPNKTGNTTVTVSGLTERGSSVKVFDNGVEVGTAQTNAVGNWKLSFELVEPSTYSRHSITAEVTTGAGIVVRSEAKTLIYNMTYTEVSKVTMIHNGQSVVFDFLDPNATIPRYSYNPSRPDFTFIVEFTNPDIAVSDVVVVTKDNGGDFRRVVTAHDAEKQQWIGADSFASADIPVWVGVDFTGTSGYVFPELPLEDDEEPEIDDELAKKIAELEKEYENAVKDKTLEETTAYFEQKDAEYKAALDQAAQELASLQDDSVAVTQDENGDTAVTFTEGGVSASMFIGTSAGLTEQVLTGRGFERMPTVDGGFVYAKADETEIGYADLNNNVYYVLNLPNLEEIPGCVKIDPDTPVENDEDREKFLDTFFSNGKAFFEWGSSFALKLGQKVVTGLIKDTHETALLVFTLASKYSLDIATKGASPDQLQSAWMLVENSKTLMNTTKWLATGIEFLNVLEKAVYAATTLERAADNIKVIFWDANKNIPENCDDLAFKQQKKNFWKNSLAYGIAQIAEVAFKVSSSILSTAVVTPAAATASLAATPAAGVATLAAGVTAQKVVGDWMGKVVDDAEFELGLVDK